MGLGETVGTLTVLFLKAIPTELRTEKGLTYQGLELTAFSVKH